MHYYLLCVSVICRIMNIMTIMLISVSALAEPRAQRRVAFEGILGGQFNKHIHSYDTYIYIV